MAGERCARKRLLLAEPPKLSSARKRTLRVWDAEQLRQFLDGIAEHRLPGLLPAAKTGMRRDQVVALGEEHQDHGLVFARPEGIPIHPDRFSRPSTA